VVAQDEEGIRAHDPVRTDPEHYTVVFENERVRVLEYRDLPGDRTSLHEHPDSIMCTLSGFRRRLLLGAAYRDVEMAAGSVQWLPAQLHAGENTGDTETHVVFVELKEPVTRPPHDLVIPLGPAGSDHLDRESPG